MRARLTNLARERQENIGLLEARLSQARLSLQVDIGFGDAVTPAPEQVAYPTLLDMPARLLRAYRPETVIAEKLQAMVMLGETNSRMKDFSIFG